MLGDDNWDDNGWDAMIIPGQEITARGPSRGGTSGQPPLRLGAPAPLSIIAAGDVHPHSSICIARRPDSPESQQYRLLRHRLKETSEPRLIGISSPVAGEGKTTVAANLALALAEGRRVKIALLDLNLRAPALAEMFGVVTPGSVADQLRHKRRDPLARWTLLELGKRLHMLAGTGGVENPAPLLASAELSILLEDLADNYDYTVVDLPAVLKTADVKSVQAELDAVVLVCKAGRSTKISISRAVDRLGPSKLHGALMLDVARRYLPS